MENEREREMGGQSKQIKRSASGGAPFTQSTNQPVAVSALSLGVVAAAAVVVVVVVVVHHGAENRAGLDSAVRFPLAADAAVRVSRRAAKRSQAKEKKENEIIGATRRRNFRRPERPVENERAKNWSDPKHEFLFEEKMTTTTKKTTGQ